MKKLFGNKILSLLMALFPKAALMGGETVTYNETVRGSKFNGNKTQVTTGGTLDMMIPQQEVVRSMLSFTYVKDVSSRGYSWVSRTKTLTITDLSISVIGNVDGIRLPGGSTIVLQGTNSIFTQGYCISTPGNLTIKGDGSLIVKGYNGIKVGYTRTGLHHFFKRA